MANAGTRMTSRQDMVAVGGPSSDAPEVLLDLLPTELLLYLLSMLHWRSLMILEQVSARCRDAVALHLGKLQYLSVDDALCGQFCPERWPDVTPRMTGSPLSDPVWALTAILSKMGNLRELHVRVPWVIERLQDLPAAVLSNSRHWPLLEKFWMTWPDSVTPERGLLRQLCTNCIRLTNVTLAGDFSDDDVEIVVTMLPALRTLYVRTYQVMGSFISHLPTDLHNLKLESPSLRSWPAVDLLRCRELRSLELPPFKHPAQLVPTLVGCVHLERLSLKHLDSAFVACLPPDGLPTLRHLTVSECHMHDADFGRLVERLPSLESVSLGRCPQLTPQGLEPISRLSALSVLRLDDPGGCVSDRLLTQLSAAPLVELQLPADPLFDEPICARLRIPKVLTVDGLLNLIRHCKSLRVLILSSGVNPRTKRISCGDGVQEQDVEHTIRFFLKRTSLRL